MKKDILTLDLQDNSPPEHIIPAAFGGKCSRRDIINGVTNNTLGSSFESELVNAFSFLMNALALRSRRGKTSGYTIPYNDDFNLISSLKPVLVRPKIEEVSNPDGKRELRIIARNTCEAFQMMSAAQSKHR